MIRSNYCLQSSFILKTFQLGLLPGRSEFASLTTKKTHLKNLSELSIGSLVINEMHNEIKRQPLKKMCLSELLPMLCSTSNNVMGHAIIEKSSIHCFYSLLGSSMEMKET